MLVKERVARGIEVLNAINPKWYKKVNVATLNVSFADRCVIGQFWGNYNDFRNSLRYSSEQMWEMGFQTMLANSWIITSTHKEYEELRDEWAARIIELEVTERVDRGIEFLDRLIFFEDGVLSSRKWFTNIDVEDFYIDDGTKCVVAQVFLKPYFESCSLIGISEEDQIKNGFLKDGKLTSDFSVKDYRFACECYNVVWMEKILQKKKEYNLKQIKIQNGE